MIIRRFIAVFLIVLGLLIVVRVFYAESKLNKSDTFSPYSLLVSSWEAYKRDFINEDGRVIDTSQGNITTSEAQSYAMLRAVYIDDKDAFDKCWSWTKDNLQKQDKLFGWKWGQIEGENYGFLKDGGENSASDADSDIALALIFASRRWNDQKYLDDAKNVLESLWNIEVRTVKDKPYLIAGNWSDFERELIINPSYFSPFAWRIFARVDDNHEWESLIDPAYNLLYEAGWNKLDKDKGVGLPPNWMSIDKESGEIKPAIIAESLNTDYSFDAIRVPFRIFLDYVWFNDKRASGYLLGNYEFIKEQFLKDRKLASGYTHDGEIINDAENPVMYSTLLGYFSLTDKNIADEIYQEKLIKLYSNKENTFNKELPYYEQNWLWFGVSLYNDFLTNLLE